MEKNVIMHKDRKIEEYVRTSDIQNLVGLYKITQ